MAGSLASRREGGSVLDTVLSVARLIGSRPWRSVLMGSGAFVGAFCVVAIIGLAQASNAEVRRQLDEMGSRLVLLSITGPVTGPPDASDRWEALSSDLGGVAVTPLVRSSYALGSDTTDELGSAVSASLWQWTPTLIETLGCEFSHGADIRSSDSDLGAPVALVGHQLGQALGPDRSTVALRGEVYQVVGVLRPFAPLPEIDNAVIIPPPPASVDLGFGAGTDAVLRAPSSETAVKAGTLAAELIELRTPGAAVSVRYANDLLKATAAVAPIVAWSAYGVAAMAALLGAFAIMNVLLTSVNERRREIGLRRALGHPIRHVAALFLLEGAILGLTGSLAGTATGLIAVWATTAVVGGWGFDPPLLEAISVVVISTILSFSAAAIPARMAVKVDPARSLQLH